MHKLFLFLIFFTNLFLLSCTNKNPEFLGLKTDEVLTHAVIKKSLDDSPMLARELRPFYEINYPNLNFSNVGVAITEFGPKDIEQGFSIENNSKIWGFVFFNRDKNEKPCTEIDFKKYIKELGIDAVKNIVYEGKRGQLDKGFFQWNDYYKDGVSYSIICREDIHAVKVLDYNVLLKYSKNEKTKELFKKNIKEMESMSKRKL